MKKSVRRQIVAAFLGFVLSAFLLIVLFNVGFMEKYYMEEKKETLKAGYQEVLKEIDSLNYIELRQFCSVNNLAIVVADYTDVQEPINFSMNLSKEDASNLAIRLFGYTYDLLEEEGVILEKNKDYTIQRNRDKTVQMDFLEIWGESDTGLSVIIRSPIEGIRDSIMLSNRFYLTIGAVVAVIGAIFINIFSRRLTRPVIELTRISQRMANLDFDAKYTSGGEDEIGILGHNFNQMSETLERTISELKTANNELQKDIEKKEEIDEMRKEFLSNVSHELKTPIALIQGYAEGLQDNISDDAESREFYCEVIIDEANKMNQMVKKLLSLNQLEFGNDQVNMERFDLTALIQGILQSSKILAEQAGAEIICRQKEPLYVWGDEFKVEEVLTNYVTNAIHHVKHENKIDIRCIQEEGTVKTVVFNTGDPIPEEELEKIWIKFYKVDKARTREYGGSGIGLSIVKAIMESMNQKCGVKNFDNGVAFWFTLEKDQ
ncbi:MAG: HAMP domain-containing protein [Clostridiales bacterium]|nr:HAMP domain-containing protein [Clostridiales bacterium]